MQQHGYELRWRVTLSLCATDVLAFSQVAEGRHGLQFRRFVIHLMLELRLSQPRVQVSSVTLNTSDAQKITMARCSKQLLLAGFVRSTFGCAAHSRLGPFGIFAWLSPA